MTSDAPESYTAPLQIPGDHPCLAGHFPGRPVVPAVVILDAVLSAADGRLVPPLRATRLVHAKFTRPLLPYERASMEFQIREGSLRFVVKAGNALVASGAFDLTSGDAS